MPRKGINFFATKDDMAAGLRAIESKEQLKYVKMGLFDFPQLEEYLSYQDLPNFGKSITGNPQTENYYLVIGRDAKVEVREVPQRGSGIKYAVDLLRNPDCLCFRLAGDYNGEYLAPGNFSPGEGPYSAKLYADFRRVFLKEFITIKSYRVGQDAVNMFYSGLPLTPNIKSGSEYYLKRE